MTTDEGTAPPVAGQTRSRRAMVLGGTGAVAGLIAMDANRAHADPTPSPAPSVTGFVEVTGHGATGNGNTDDTAAIQAAIDAAQPGATIYFPPGTYRASATLKPRANQTLLGVYPNSIIKTVDRVDSFTMFLADASGGPVQFDGLVLDLNRSKTTAPPPNHDNTAVGAYVGVGIYYLGAGQGSLGNRVSRCEVRNAWETGIVLQRPDNVEQFDILVEHTKVTGCGAGIMIFQGTRTRILNCEASDNMREDNPASNGVTITHCGDAVIQSTSSLRNGRHGILAKYCWDFKIFGCTSNGNGLLPGSNQPQYGWGIVVGRSNDTFAEHNHSTDVIIADNTCDGNTRGGITMDVTVREENHLPQETRAVVSGNICSGGTEAAVHGIQLSRVRSATVTGNICREMPHTGIAITLCTHVVVAENVLQNNGVRGIFVQAIDNPVPYGWHMIGPNHYMGNGREALGIAETNLQNVVVLEPEELIKFDAAQAGFFGAAPAERPEPYQLTDGTAGRTFDPNTAGNREVANVLATVINDLKTLGLLE